MSEIKFLVPDPDAPGYLRREIQRVEFLEQYREEQDARKALKMLVEYLLEFVTEPEDKGQAREMLLDAPKSTIDELMRYFVLGAVPSEVSDPEKEGSEAG